MDTLMGFKFLNELRLKKQLCDIVIRVDDGEFHAHKNILCAYSMYFRTLFTSSSTTNNNECTIPDVSSEIMELILEYVYTQHVKITEEKGRKLLITADYLQVSGLVNECCMFLEAQLCLKNCIGIWHFAQLYVFRTLEQQAFRFILHNFKEMVQVSEEFLDLTVGQLSEITGNDELNVKHEDVVFQAILRWIKHDQPKRKAHIGVLLAMVRLELLTPYFLVNNVWNHPLVADDEACQQFIRSVPAFTSDLSASHGLDVVRPRLPSAILLAIGGCGRGGPTNAIEAYDIRANRWVSVACTDESPVAYHGTVYLNGFLYCIGGFDGLNYFSKVRRFDPIARTWAQVGPMHFCRCYVSVCALDGCIYAMGGFSGYYRMNTAERYDPESNQWSIIASMYYRRSDAGATVLNGKVYIYGGFNGTESLSTVEYYSPQTNQWTLIPCMNTRRSGLGVITYYGKIYAVGGFDGFRRLRSVEAYNPEIRLWENVTEMINQRSNFGIEVIDDLLFVVGGFNGIYTVNYVECYDKKSNLWSEVKNMKIHRSALSCCVVSGLPNMADYAAPRDSSYEDLQSLHSMTLYI